MKWVRARIELDQKGIDAGHRYEVVVGDGAHSESFVLAGNDKYSSDARWQMLLGESMSLFSWGGHTSEGLYVRVSRQYPNDKFDFSPEAYQRGNWLENDADVMQFRLYNPFLARPYLQFAKSNSKWDGPEFPFSEGDQKTFQYDVEDFWLQDENKWWGKAEKGVKYTVRRNDDTSDFKEFVIRLSV